MERNIHSFLVQSFCQENRNAAVELECVAIVCAMQALYVYLEGRKFIVENDYQLQQMVNKNNRLTRWALILQQYEMNTRYRPEMANGNADAPEKAFVADPLGAEEHRVAE